MEEMPLDVALKIAISNYGVEHFKNCGCDEEYYGCGHDAATRIAEELERVTKKKRRS